ncbi:hypothetical protein IAT40_004257 [Kwoniella sp. CBS 6097]
MQPTERSAENTGLLTVPLAELGEASSRNTSPGSDAHNKDKDENSISPPDLSTFPSCPPDTSTNEPEARWDRISSAQLTSKVGSYSTKKQKPGRNVNSDSWLKSFPTCAAPFCKYSNSRSEQH